MVAFCPLCASDDHTSDHVTDDGRKYSLCVDKSHGIEGFVWEPPQPPGRSHRADGLGAELDIWDKLLEVVPPDDAAHAYGEIEDRFFAAYPADVDFLLKRYGHKWRDSDHPSGHYSMSSYLASRLKELEREGHLDLTWAPATGKWSHNSVISQWKRN